MHCLPNPSVGNDDGRGGFAALNNGKNILLVDMTDKPVTPEGIVFCIGLISVFLLFCFVICKT